MFFKFFVEFFHLQYNLITLLAYFCILLRTKQLDTIADIPNSIEDCMKVVLMYIFSYFANAKVKQLRRDI